jgi:hypothetical protein
MKKGFEAQYGTPAHTSNVYTILNDSVCKCHVTLTQERSSMSRTGVQMLGQFSQKAMK